MEQTNEIETKCECTMASGWLHALVRRLCGCHNGQCWCKWGHFDYNKPTHMLWYRWLACCERIADKPRVYRLTLADALCRMAAKLRRDKTTELFYARGNEAAAVAEGLRFRFVSGCYPLTLEREECDESIDDVNKLEAMARGISWLETEPPNTENTHMSSTKMKTLTIDRRKWETPPDFDPGDSAPWTEVEWQEYMNQEPLPPNQAFMLPAEEQPTEEPNQTHLQLP